MPAHALLQVGQVILSLPHSLSQTGLPHGSAVLGSQEPEGEIAKLWPPPATLRVTTPEVVKDLLKTNSENLVYYAKFEDHNWASHAASSS